jgi:nicotinic acid mononucleotide adenylyltransferase
LDQWANVEKIKSEFGFVEIPVQSMRATKLREMRQAGVSSWKRYVPAMVARYIEMHGLYQEAA